MPLTSAILRRGFANDWADRKHDIHLYDPITGQTEDYIIGARPQEIKDWVMGLQQRYGNAPLAVCTEQKRGPLIYALGVLLLAGRSVHAYGVSQMNEKFVFRVSGMAMTFTALLTSSCVLLFSFFTK